MTSKISNVLAPRLRDLEARSFIGYPLTRVDLNSILGAILYRDFFRTANFVRVFARLYCGASTSAGALFLLLVYSLASSRLPRFCTLFGPPAPIFALHPHFYPRAEKQYNRLLSPLFSEI
jgi:hypothetical protein